MIGDDRNRELVKQRYGFADWDRGRERERAQQYVSHLPSDVLPLPRIERVAFDGGYIDTYGDGGEIVVTVWIHQHASPDRAREAMIDFLMTCMAQRLPDASEKDLQIGDVAFVGHDETQTSLVFVRDDVFVRVHSVGETDYPIGELADVVDQAIK
ncbi:MAG: hypothetical protein O6909_11300 [Alphaproteobacteria bacterium]|jgi:hypothetical protein|nr:hypothetical protein [Alphaproteobacteria bacterium]